MRCVIISNGNISDYEYIRSLICDDDFVITADGALKHCVKMGIVPNVWIGDNDSCTLSEIELDTLAHNVEVVRLNPIKDATDTEAACDYAIGRGFDEVMMLGSCGTRFDHTLANVYLLKKFADKGVDAKIVNENNIIFLAKEHNIIVNGIYNNVSILPIENNVTSISNRGFYYPLDKEPLAMYSSRGVSNRLTGDVGEIILEGGTALIVLSRD